MGHSPFISCYSLFAIRRRWLILALLLVAAGLLVWWLWPRDDGVLAEIKRRGTLRVGLDASFPPFESFNAAGQIVGLDVDLAQAVAADLGVTLEPVNIGFDGLYDALLARRADLVISGLPYDARWTKDVAYTRNYFNAGQVLLIPAGSAAIKTRADLPGHTLAIEWGSQADMEARRLTKELPNLTLVRRPTAAEAVTALLNGQADAAIVDGVTAVAAEPRGAKIAAHLTDEWYAAAVHIQSRDLLEAVNRTFARLEDSGELAKLQARWLATQP